MSPANPEVLLTRSVETDALRSCSSSWRLFGEGQQCSDVELCTQVFGCRLRLSLGRWERRVAGDRLVVYGVSTPCPYLGMGPAPPMIFCSIRYLVKIYSIEENKYESLHPQGGLRGCDAVERRYAITAKPEILSALRNF